MATIGSTALTEPAASSSGRLSFLHALRALRGITFREMSKFFHQYGRLGSALVRPALWLIIFAAGMGNLLGVSPEEPYSTYITYQEYIVPGLIGVVLLFNGMQSSLSLVYDREVGTMRLLLTAPVPRWYLLFSKLIAGTILSVVQGFAFLAIARLVGVYVPLSGLGYMLPAMFLGGFMLGAIGLLLSVYVKQLENFAGTMNFVIFPMFFLSSALYPLWQLRESGAEYLYWVSVFNPFHHVVELIRYAAYSKFTATSFFVVLGTAIICFLLAVIAYDPQRGLIRRRRA